MIIVGVKRCAEHITTGHYARNLLLLEEFSTIGAKVLTGWSGKKARAPSVSWVRRCRTHAMNPHH